MDVWSEWLSNHAQAISVDQKKNACGYFGRRGVMKTIIFETQLTVTANWYIEVHLFPLFSTLKDVRPKSQLRTWFLHHDIAPAYRAQATTLIISSLQVLHC